MKKKKERERESYTHTYTQPPQAKEEKVNENDEVVEEGEKGRQEGINLAIANWLGSIGKLRWLWQFLLPTRLLLLMAVQSRPDDTHTKVTFSIEKRVLTAEITRGQMLKQRQQQQQLQCKHKSSLGKHTH